MKNTGGFGEYFNPKKFDIEHRATKAEKIGCTIFLVSAMSVIIFGLLQ